MEKVNCGRHISPSTINLTTNASILGFLLYKLLLVDQILNQKYKRILDRWRLMQLQYLFQPQTIRVQNVNINVGDGVVLHDYWHLLRMYA